MPKIEPPFSFPRLDALKERGENAMSETREIIHDMRRLAIDTRREIAVSLRLGGAFR